MTGPHCHDTSTCLEHRREQFSPHENRTIDQWNRTPCRNCKIGIERANEAATTRPPICEHDGCETRITQQARFCVRHSGKYARARKMGPPCERCGTPRGMNSKSQYCAYCRVEMSHHRKRYFNCKKCSKPINNLSGFCWTCIQERKGERG